MAGSYLGVTGETRGPKVSGRRQYLGDAAVTCVVSPGLAWLLSGDLFAAFRGHVAVQLWSYWSARSRIAARTNELDAAKRGRIIGSEKGFLLVFLYERVLLVFPGVWRTDWSHRTPFAGF